MNAEMAIKKYIDSIKSDVFARYEKEFAQRVASALSSGYQQGLTELPLVKIVENVVNGINNFTMKNNRLYPEISTRSIFIHGNRSHVKFDYCGRHVRTEFGDLVFIASVVFNCQKYFEKFTINQFKNDRRDFRSAYWSINKKQLYLLSRFPIFRGAIGFIPKRDFSLPNYSGCLGSYGLLYRPGDFAFVSATELASLIGSRSGLKEKELRYLTSKPDERQLHIFPCAYPLNELPHFMLHCGWHLPLNLLGNYHHAHNVFDFVHKYLRMGIGEPSDSQARNFLKELLSTVKLKAEREGDKNMLKFVEGFFRYRYADGGEGEFSESVEFNQGGGVGIIHTLINLGE